MPFPQEMKLFRLRNAAGMELRLCAFGATLVSLRAPGRGGRAQWLDLGYARLEDYFQGAKRPYFGACVGRFANRIAGAHFKLGGKLHRLGKGESGHCLHGGILGFDRRPWEGRLIQGPGWTGVSFTRLSPDGEEGFPGNLRVEVQYRLGRGTAFSFQARARTDKATPVSLCNHSYFNLGGPDSGGVLGHKLRLGAEAYLPLGPGGIPTGELRAVAGTPFDFRRLRPIGRAYDHNFVLARRWQPGRLRHAATLEHEGSRRRLELWTDKPGLQVYTGAKLQGPAPGRHGKPYQAFAGVALEPQHFPDSPNQRHFPSPILKPGQIYRTKTLYRFSNF